MKAILYHFRKWIQSIFFYPVDSIHPETSQDYDVYWDKKRGNRLGDLSSWQKERADFVLGIVTSEGGTVSLGDIGCGDGSILRYIKNSTSLVAETRGYDNSPLALRRAEESGIVTTQVDVSIRGAETRIDTADYYLLLETLEHIPHSEELFIKLLTKAGKGVFFSFPNTGYFTYRLRLLFGKFPAQWHVMPNEHLRFWTYSDLVWWLGALGVSSYTIHTYKGIPVLNKIFPSLFGAAFIVFVPKKVATKEQVQ